MSERWFDGESLRFRSKQRIPYYCYCLQSQIIREDVSKHQENYRRQKWKWKVVPGMEICRHGGRYLLCAYLSEVCLRFLWCGERTYFGQNERTLSFKMVDKCCVDEPGFHACLQQHKVTESKGSWDETISIDSGKNQVDQISSLRKHVLCRVMCWILSEYLES